MQLEDSTVPTLEVIIQYLLSIPIVLRLSQNQVSKIPTVASYYTQSHLCTGFTKEQCCNQSRKDGRGSTSRIRTGMQVWFKRTKSSCILTRSQGTVSKITPKLQHVLLRSRIAEVKASLVTNCVTLDKSLSSSESVSLSANNSNSFIGMLGELKEQCL